MIFFAVAAPTPGSDSRSFWLPVLRSTVPAGPVFFDGFASGTKNTGRYRGLGPDVDHESTDRDPRRPVVRGRKIETPRKPVVDVLQAREEKEQTAGDERKQGQSLDEVEKVLEGWPRPQSRVHRPQFRQEEWDRGEASHDMKPLGHPVQAGRTAGPFEPRRWVLDEVRDQSRQKTDRERDSQRNAEDGTGALGVDPALERSIGQRSGFRTVASVKGREQAFCAAERHQQNRATVAAKAEWGMAAATLCASSIWSTSARHGNSAVRNPRE